MQKTLRRSEDISNEGYVPIDLLAKGAVQLYSLGRNLSIELMSDTEALKKELGVFHGDEISFSLLSLCNKFILCASVEISHLNVITL